MAQLWHPLAGLPAEMLLLSTDLLNMPLPFGVGVPPHIAFGEDFAAAQMVGGPDDVFSVCSAGTDKDSGTSSPLLARQHTTSTSSTDSADGAPTPGPSTSTNMASPSPAAPAERGVKRVKTEQLSLDADFAAQQQALAMAEGDDGEDSCGEESGSGAVGNETEAVRRRRAHLASEKKRRNNLKDAFEEMKQMIPQCRNFPHSKNSKESVLRKACDYIRYLHIQRAQMAEEIKYLRETIAKHNIEPPAVPVRTDAASLDDDTGAFPAGAKMLVLLSLVDALYEEFMAHVSIRSPEEFSLTLLTFFQQQCRPEKLHSMVVGALHSMALNFSPITDGSSCRIRKWLDALNMCNVSGFDEHLSGRVRGILNSVLTHFAL